MCLESITSLFFIHLEIYFSLNSSGWAFLSMTKFQIRRSISGMKTVSIGPFSVGKKTPFTLLSGPCVIESREHALETAHFLVECTKKLGIQFVYKSSYDKANRSSISSFRGPGIDKGLSILSEVKSTYNIPVVSDIHLPDEAPLAAEVLDIIQIPAFLSRQTDLLIAAAKTGKTINVKKGQFLAPWDMKNVVEKILEAGNHNLILCDRGTSFGYNNLVSDMRSIPIMQSFGFPVCYDASHSVMLPGGQGTASGGQREFIPHLMKAAIAAGANLIFLESHPHPADAKSDAATVFPFDSLERLLQEAKGLYDYINSI